MSTYHYDRMDPYDDYVSRWSDACRAGGGTVEGTDIIRLRGAPGNLPVYGVVRFDGTPAEAVSEARSWQEEGAPFSFIARDATVAEALLGLGLVPMNRFGLVRARVQDLGQPTHEVQWTGDVERVMTVQAQCHDIPPPAVPRAVEAMTKLHASGKEQFVLVEADDQPVACASLYVGNGNAGIYAASVLPSHRRQGIGRSMAQALMRRAIELELREAVATTTPDGGALSQALGAAVTGQIQQMAWFPRGPPGTR